MMENINLADFDEAQGFEIDNDSKAEWALKKVLEAKAERERLTSLVNSEIDLLKVRQAEIDRRYENDTSYLLSKLRAYMETVNTKSTKTQSTYQLLSGKLVIKHAKTDLKENTELLDWCKRNAPEYVKTKEEVMWGEFKKKITPTEAGVIFADTGEFVEGIEMVEKPAEFDVKA